MTWPQIAAGDLAVLLVLAVVFAWRTPRHLKPPAVRDSPRARPGLQTPAAGKRTSGAPKETHPPASARQPSAREPGLQAPHNPHAPAVLTKSWPCGCQKTWDAFGRLIWSLPCEQAADWAAWAKEVSQ